MNKSSAVLLIGLAMAFLAGAGLNFVHAALTLAAGNHSSYVLGSALGHGLIGLLFLLIAFKAFRNGRAKLVAASSRSTSD
jgi:hypothetical protein